VLAATLHDVLPEYRRALAAVAGDDELSDEDRETFMLLGIVALTHHRHALSHAFAGAERSDPVDWSAGMVLRFASEGLVMLRNGTSIAERRALPLTSEGELGEIYQGDGGIDAWVDAHLAPDERG
jgi:hypothetical protein